MMLPKQIKGHKYL